MKFSLLAAQILAAVAVLALPNAASAQEERHVSNGDAARATYLVAQASPLLSKSAKTAISQDFNGAPLAGKPRIHLVKAKSVSCRVRTASVDETSSKTHGALCTIDYGHGRIVELKEADSWDLYEALGVAGVQDGAGMSHLERAVHKLACTVNDRIAQHTPASGDKVAGFDCRFRLDQ